MGCDALLNSPDALINIIKNKAMINGLRYNQKGHNINQIVKEAILEKYNDMFKTELSELNKCNIAKHSIQTIAENPINQRNS